MELNDITTIHTMHIHTQFRHLSLLYVQVYKLTCNVSVYPRMTAGQLPKNWFELANDHCCYVMAC